MGQLAKADALYTEAIGSAFNTSDEMFAADALLNAFDSGDPEALNQATKNQSFQFLPNDIAVLARKLKPQPGGGGRRMAQRAEELSAQHGPKATPAPMPAAAEGGDAPAASEEAAAPSPTQGEETDEEDLL